MNIYGQIPRPSSCPVRKERRHIAATNAHIELCSKLDDILRKIDSSSLTIAPPGLSTDGKSMPVANDGFHKLEHAINDHSSFIRHQLRDISDKMETAMNLESRLQRLETLFVCSPTNSPSVDEVLNKMFFDKLGTNQPEMELSPIKSSEAVENITDIELTVPMTPNIANLDQIGKTLLFDISEATADASIQTTAVKIDDLSSVVEAMTIWRNIDNESTIGTQTDHLYHAVDAATDTEVDSSEAIEAALQFIEAPEKETNKIKPCILDEEFMKVLLRSMEQKFDSRLDAMCRR